MSTPPSSSGGVLPKSQKAKRKISLPWFRQGSVAQPHPTLTRQHTIDTPSSFQARLLRRQPSQSALAGVLEMTWVVSDFTATCPQELSVSKGQQVEVVEVCTSKPDYCLVRMPTRGTSSDHDTVPEGMVPLAVLKQPPAPRSSPSRRAPADHDIDTTTTTNDSTGTVNTSSPVNKRRGFSGRKWLPPQLRKLSQGKVDKTQQQQQQAAQQPAAADRPPLKKTGSDKRIKVPSEMGNKPSVSEGEDDEDRPPLPLKTSGAKPSSASSATTTTDLTNGGGEDADEEVELPPPMKPIQEPILVTSPPPGVPDIEENPGKREQHSENQERNSLLRSSADGHVSSDYLVSELSAQCSSANNEATALAFSGDESDNKPSSEDNNVMDNAEKMENLLKKRKYVLDELMNTEDAYVKDLQLIVEGYIKTMRSGCEDPPMPDDLKDGKDKIVFGNIEAIYEWHKETFLKSLKKVIENPIELGQLFRKYERKLHMYVVYCKNKPFSEYIVSEHLDGYFEELRIKLGHKLQLCDLLIKPVQRIMKYQLLLKDILKYTERTGNMPEIESLRAAYEIMVVVPKAANDMMDVGRLQGFDGKITAQGKLLLHGMLNCSDTGATTTVGKNKELLVFLFEQSIIFSEVIGKKALFSSQQYIYKTHIQVNKMSLTPKEDCFIISSTDPNKPTISIQCQVNEQELEEQWITTINNILQTQNNFLKALQSPIQYQNQLTKEASHSFEASMWNPTVHRNTVSSTPTTPTSDAIKINRKTVPYIHKANTIGLPMENDLVLNNTPSNNNHSEQVEKKTKFFLGGFKKKHKTDSMGLESAKASSATANDKNETMHRRWSETNQPTV